MINFLILVFEEITEKKIYNTLFIIAYNNKINFTLQKMPNI